MEQWQVLDLLIALVEKSLVVYEDLDGHGRYRLLETVRQYSRDRLQETGEAAAARGRHEDYYRRFAEEARPRLIGPEQGAWLDSLEREHDNLRAALAWSHEGVAGAEQELRLAAALQRFWQVRGHLSEGRRWYAEALQRDAGSGGAAEKGWQEARAAALHAAGTLAFLQGDYPGAQQLQDEALVLYRQLADRRGTAATLGNLGLVARQQGDFRRAKAQYEGSLAVMRELSDQAGCANALNNLAVLACDEGDLSSARRLFDESLLLRRELGDTQGTADALNNLGLVACYDGDYGTARRLLEESLTVYRGLQDTQNIAGTLGNLGLVAFEQGDYRAATARYVESLILMRAVGDRGSIAGTLLGMAALAQVQEQAERAACLYGASAALREALGLSLTTEEEDETAMNLTAVRAALGEEAFMAAWAQGQAMTHEQAVEYALDPAMT